jgi:hypothetical protein
MAIRMKGSRPVSAGDIVALEHALGLKLPGQYREFLLQYNAATPETNVFDIPGGSNQSAVNKFIPIEGLLSERKNVDGVACRFLAVAWAEGGNYVCLDLDSGGEVFFWDHERPSDELRLATNWNAFVEMLCPFDVSTIELKPGQVKKVWVDPEFLRDLREQ